MRVDWTSARHTVDSEVEPSDSESEDDFGFDYDTVDNSENSINNNRFRNKSTYLTPGKNLEKIYLSITADNIEVQSSFH